MRFLIATLLCFVYYVEANNILLSNKDVNLRAEARAFESIVTKTAECIRTVLKEGDESIGLPPIDPLYTNLEIDLAALTGNFLQGYFNVNNLSLIGASSFKLGKLKGKATLLPPTYCLDFELVLPHISLDLHHDFNLPFINFTGNGDLKFDVTNFKAPGKVCIKLFPNAITSLKVKLSIDNNNFLITGVNDDEMLCDYVSELITKQLKNYLKDNEVEITTKIEEFALPAVNSCFDDPTSTIEGICKALQYIQKKCLF